MKQMCKKNKHVYKNNWWVNSCMLSTVKIVYWMQSLKLSLKLALKRIPLVQSLCVDHVQPFPAGHIKCEAEKVPSCTVQRRCIE